MPAPTLAPDAVRTLVDNLQAAFRVECSARVRYPAFAEEADREGYGPIASLFRAAAFGEEIHSRNHDKVLRGLGTQPEPPLFEAPVVKSTAENIEAAIAAESHEHDVLYPTLLAQARLAGHDPASDTFLLAKAVEAEHVRTFIEARERLKRSRGHNVRYYVCPQCGFFSQTLDFSDCAICDGLAEEFVEIH